jgi:hypothetical protein
VATVSPEESVPVTDTGDPMYFGDGVVATITLPLWR